MTADALVMTLSVRIRWWVYPYLRTIKAFCLLFGTDPDIERICKFIMDYGVRIKVTQP